MEENFKHNGENSNLLSQSYVDGIQKLTGNGESIPQDFHVPAEILEKRKNSWNSFFQKYSSMASEVEINIKTLQPEELQSGDCQPVKPQPERSEMMEPNQGEIENIKQRLPMRKPMWMVQYWVDNGNQPHMEETDNGNVSDSGSSLAEEEFNKSSKNLYKCNEVSDLSLEKNFGVIDKLENVHLIIDDSSSSTVDTAAYILANTCTTKKADTIAIVEGSKSFEEKQPKLKHSIEHVDYTDIIRRNSHKENMKGKELQAKSNSNDISQNNIILNSDNSNSNKKIVEESIQKEKNCFLSIFFSDSDESMKNKDNYMGIKHSYHDTDTNACSIIPNDNQTMSNSTKLLKRKKLYNRSESPADFTPVSEDNLSCKLSGRSMRKSISLRKCEHPALDTPKLTARPSYVVKYHRMRYRRKRNMLSSLKSAIQQSKANFSQNGNNSQTPLESPEVLNEENNSVQSDCNQNLRSPESMKHNDIDSETMKDVKRNHKNSIISDLVLSPSKKLLEKNTCINPSKKYNNKIQLKPLAINIFKLPYKYEELRESISKGIKENDAVLNNNSCGVTNKHLEENHQLRSSIVVSVDADKTKDFYMNHIDDDDDFMSLVNDLFQKSIGKKQMSESSGETMITLSEIQFNPREIKSNLPYDTDSNLLRKSSNVTSTQSELSATRNLCKNQSATAVRQSSRFIIANSSSDENEFPVSPIKKKKSSKKVMNSQDDRGVVQNAIKMKSRLSDIDSISTHVSEKIIRSRESSSMDANTIEDSKKIIENTKENFVHNRNKLKRSGIPQNMSHGSNTPSNTSSRNYNELRISNFTDELLSVKQINNHKLCCDIESDQIVGEKKSKSHFIKENYLSSAKELQNVGDKLIYNGSSESSPEKMKDSNEFPDSAFQKVELHKKRSVQLEKNKERTGSQRYSDKIRKRSFKQFTDDSPRENLASSSTETKENGYLKKNNDERKEKKKSKKTLKKGFAISFSSDDECVIPLKIGSFDKLNSSNNNENISSERINLEDLSIDGIIF